MASKQLFNHNYNRINSAMPISREVNLLGNLHGEILAKGWELMCSQILKNYQMGKSTVIPKFGLFTFQNPLISLEGTTNEVSRDKRSRYPVFIVSSDFVQGVRPGIFSEKGSATHYEQRQSNGVNSVKINYAEIAISLNVGKAEATTIIDNLIRFLGDKIRSNEFKNKDLPGIGSLIFINKLLPVKFHHSIIDKIQNNAQKYKEMKKHIILSHEYKQESLEDQMRNTFNKSNAGYKFTNLNSHTNNYQQFGAIRNLPNLSKSVASFRPQSALLCKVTAKGEEWLKQNLDLDLKNEVDENGYPIIDSNNNDEEYAASKVKNFFNDTGKNNKIIPKKLRDLNIRDSILEEIIYQKSFIVNQMKQLDTSRKGQLSVEKMIQAFMAARIEDLDRDISYSLIKLYMKNENNNSNNHGKSVSNLDGLSKSSYNTFVQSNASKMFVSTKIDTTDYISLMLNLVKDIKDILTKNDKFINKSSSTNKFSNSNFNNRSVSNLQRKNSNMSNRSIKSSTGLNDAINAFKKNGNLNNTYKEKASFSNRNNESLNTKNISLEEVKTEVITIKTVAGNIKDRYSVRLGQIISDREFASILRDFSIIYPLEKIDDILVFLELDPRFFTLINFFKNLDNCKILVNETLTNDIVKAIKKIKDIAYANGAHKFFFPQFPNNQSISKTEFIKKVRTHFKAFSEDLCLGVFYYITKMDRDMTYSDYLKYFATNTSSANENIFLNQENFIHHATEVIITKMKRNHLKEEEYFDRFLRFKNNRKENLLNKYDFHFALEKELFEFSAEERDILFRAMDKKKDEVIDRDEFVSFLRVVHDPLYKLQDTIKKNNLEIEEILFRMNLHPDTHEVLDFWTFKTRMLLLNSGFTHEFIFSLFLNLKNADDKVDSRKIINEFNVFKKQNFRELNTGSFKTNFLNYYRKYGAFRSMKDAFEKRDIASTGLLDKVEFCNVVLRFNKPKEEDYNKIYNQVEDRETKNFEDLKYREDDYKTEDVMKICRICELYGKDNKVNYTKFLELVFYDKTNNNFNLICDKLSETANNISTYINKTDKLAKIKTSNYTTYDAVFNELMKDILSTIKSQSKQSSLEKGISIADMQLFIELKFNIKAKKSTIQLFDVDKDGYIDQEDLKSILSRYVKNHYFKYESIPEGLESRPNFYCEETLSEEKFKLLVKDIKSAMKLKNLTDVGLFNKLDTNKDGFLTAPEFNENIDQIYPMTSNIKDQFYCFLDARKLGLIDLDTFKKRFKEFSSVDVIVNNDWETEERIINEFKKYLKINCIDRKLTIYEIFALLDFNCDGKVDVNDMKKFIIDKMLFSVYEINDFKTERVLQHISRSKLNFFTIHDVKEFINDFVIESNPLTKEFNNTTKEKFNVNSALNGVDWLTSVLEKFGLFVTENFANFENFFEAVNKGNSNSEKIKLNDFLNFISLNNLSLKGFNLTQDELIKFFTALDAHKKSFITISDIKNKLNDFDFYKRMKLSIKTFLKNNFKCGVEAFKFFINDVTIREEKTLPNYLSRKEFFDGIKNIFPDTYSTENILAFIRMNFKDENFITFIEFNFIFFDEVTHDTILDKTNVFSRLTSAKTGNSKLRASSAFTKHNPKTKLVTPYDEDALEKLRRLLKSSRFNYDSFFKMYDVLNNGFVNQSEFRNMIKKLNIGLTGLEIDEIISKSGKNKEGKIHMQEFMKFMNSEDKSISQIKENVRSFVSDLKQLVYKYYANPRLAFQFVSILLLIFYYYTYYQY